MNKRLLTLFVLMVHLCLGTRLLAQGETVVTPYGGLDIVFLVDQSGSMGGANYGFEGEGSDPLDLRFGAIDYAIDALGQYRLTLASDISMQIAVINFGDESSREDMARGWIPIAESGEQSAWDSLYETLSSELSAPAFRERSADNTDNLGNTNFLDAFSAASTMYSRLPDDSAAPHLRAIILLTDGAPCVPSDFACGDLTGQTTHMAAVDSFINREFTDDRYVLYVIALDAQNDFWPTWIDEWQSITRNPEQAARAETNQQVGVRFYNIMIELVRRVRGLDIAPEHLVVGENRVVLPPYLAEARLSIFKSSRSPGLLQLLRPDGRELAITDSEISVTNQNSPIEIWTISNPVPGEWQIIVGSEDDRVDVYLELIPIEVNANLTATSFIQFTDIDLSFELTDSDDNPLLILNDPYDLNVTVSIIQPDEATFSRPLTYEIDGIFTGNFRAEQSGMHRVLLEATTRTVDERIYTVFENRQVATFDVLGINLDIDSMPSGNYLMGQVIPVTAMLRDQNGGLLDLDNVEIIAEQVVNDTIVTYTFAYNEANKHYTLALPAEDDGNYLLTVRAIVNGISQTMTLATTAETRYVVLESNLIGLRPILPAENPSTQLTHTNAFPPVANDIVIELESYLLESDTPIALEDVSLNPDALWSYRVQHDDADYTDTVIDFAPTEVEGQYRLRIHQPPAGAYTISINAGGDFQGTYLLQPDAGIRMTVIVQKSWLPEIIYAIIALVVVFTILLLIRRQRKLSQLRKHPALGLIELQEDESKITVWSYNLDKKRHNRVLLKESSLRKYGVKSILVECPDDRHSRDRKVVVSVEMHSGQRFPRRTLSPGKTLRLFQGSLARGSGEENKRYILVKDPKMLAL